MTKFFFNFALALMVSMGVTTAFAQQEVLTNDNLSTAIADGGGIGGAGKGGATECVTSRTYSSSGVESGTDCSIRLPAPKVDTSPCAKIAQVVRKGACTAAAQDLASLRSGTVSYRYFTESFRRELALAGLTLEDFKMSEAKLRELQVIGAKHSAKLYLTHLRQGTSSYKFFMRGLREEMKAGGLTPADIGSSEFELADISQSKN
jgi:hypothetical protein